MTNRLIKTCQELNECEGMGDSPVRISIKGEVGTVHVGPYGQIITVNSGISYNLYDETIPYLKIDDQSEWSSAKILKRAGWDAIGGTLINWLVEIELSKTYYSDTLDAQWLRLSDMAELLERDDIKEIRQSLKEGLAELAYMQAIILLYKIDRESYNLGMAPLLKVEGSKL